MILQQLYNDAEAILGQELPPPLYDNKPVRWIIRLDEDGRYLGCIKSGDKKGTPRLIPYIGRTSGIRPILLADTPAYALGFPPDDKKVLTKHHAFVELLKQCHQSSGVKELTSVISFLQAFGNGEIELKETEEMGASDILTFQIGTTFPVDIPEVREFWATNAKGEVDSAGTKMQCLVTGQKTNVGQSLPGMVKSVPGGQSSGVAYISANADAYESYGLSRAETSPVSQEAAERFTKALNHLITSRSNRVFLFERELKVEQARSSINMAGMLYVFWTKQGAFNELTHMLGGADPETIKELLNAYRSGKRHYTHLDEEQFFALGISGSGGRLVVRDWLTCTVQEAMDNMARWFQAQEIIAYDGGEPRPYKAYTLAASLFLDINKEKYMEAPRAIMRAALHGDPLPLSMLSKAVLRCRAEQGVTNPRAALIKAILVTRKKGDDTLKALDATNTNPAYNCGRLLASLERIQRTALGKINATLVDRYFGAASTRPRTVLSQLVAQANKAHLGKIRRTRPGSYIALQKELEDILDNIPARAFPAALTLEEQALFILGYYHQRAENSRRAKAAMEAKESGQSTPAAADFDLEPELTTIDEENE